MTTMFTSLPMVDMAPLHATKPSVEELQVLSKQLHEVFRTTGFAYLINPPLSFSHDDVFSIAKEFFSMDEEEKMKVAKDTFRKQNSNTYRGYFPAIRGSDNLKEGFEMGSSASKSAASVPSNSPFTLTEPNIFPPSSAFPSRPRAEKLYTELQSLSSVLLSLLATSLGKPANTFTRLLHNSVSTLRLLHYPSILSPAPKQELNCTPHTDSGLLTLLHQDAIGGLEVLNSAGEWIPAPYVPGSLVVNIGDLMAQMSGGQFVATFHRVRSSGAERYSVPFFCEPGVDELVGEEGREVRYEEWVLGKMGTWVEFRDVEEEGSGFGSGAGQEVSVGA
ncbi:MAG: hypothetical protein MMC23_005835 [Stictis urceolatum]|nr:hypothetical protein [Stictis urceolata]